MASKNDNLIRRSAIAHLLMCASLSESPAQRRELRDVTQRLENIDGIDRGLDGAANAPVLQLVRDEVTA